MSERSEDKNQTEPLSLDISGIEVQSPQTISSTSSDEQSQSDKESVSDSGTNREIKVEGWKFWWKVSWKHNEQERDLCFSSRWKAEDFQKGLEEGWPELLMDMMEERRLDRP